MQATQISNRALEQSALRLLLERFGAAASKAGQEREFFKTWGRSRLLRRPHRPRCF